MNVERVAIVGTNPITVAIALTLKAHKDALEIVGYDAETVTADLARARGAYDRAERKLDRVCQDADVVFVAVSLSDVRETFATIAPHLKPGAFVIDTTRLKAPVMRWAEELLPDNVFFVGGHLVPNPAVVGLEALEDLDKVNADLLKEALYCFVTPPGVADVVINACAGLAQALGVNPLFMDVTEHDGLQAGVEGLSDIVAVALLRATMDTPGWEEMRKFAARRFATSTEAADDAPDRHFAIFLNRENILRRLDVLLHELLYLRDLLSQDRQEMLKEAFVAAAEGREQWIAERNQGMWISEQTGSSVQIPNAGRQIRQMFLGGRPGRRDEDTRRSRKK
jgi:prephenate dehydrogenase